jgi:hypothetical protein
MNAWHGVVLAHQGGWDEILLIAVPGVLFFFFRWLASKRPDPEAEPDVDGLPGPHDAP